jgi:hypothetical protein
MYKLISNLSIVFGSLATLTVFFNYYLLFGLFLSLLGFIASVFSIFYETKYQIERKIFSKSYIGLFLSSVPVLFIIYIVVVLKD